MKFQTWAKESSDLWVGQFASTVEYMFSLDQAYSVKMAGY